MNRYIMSKYTGCLIILLLIFWLPLNCRACELSKGFSDSMQKLGEGVETVINEIKKVPDSAAVKQLDRDITRIVEELKASGQMADEKIRNEVIPELKRGVKQLLPKCKKPKCSKYDNCV